MFTLLPSKVLEPVWGTAAEMRFVFPPIKCYKVLNHNPEPPVFMVSHKAPSLIHQKHTKSECGEAPGGSSSAEGAGYSYKHFYLLHLYIWPKSN